MDDSSVILPPSVENVITKICTDKGIDPPDLWARRRLAAVDEAVAIEILSKIYNQQSQIRNLSRLIVWYIVNPQSPVRSSAQRSPGVHPQTQSPQSPDGYPHQSPSSNSPFQNDQSLVRQPHRSTSNRHTHQSPPCCEVQSCQSPIGHHHPNPSSYSSFQDDQNFNEHSHQNLRNNQVQTLSSIPSPRERGSPSFCDHVRAAAASSPSGNSDFKSSPFAL